MLSIRVQTEGLSVADWPLWFNDQLFSKRGAIINLLIRRSKAVLTQCFGIKNTNIPFPARKLNTETSFRMHVNMDTFCKKRVNLRRLYLCSCVAVGCLAPPPHYLLSPLDASYVARWASLGLSHLKKKKTARRLKTKKEKKKVGAK